MLHPCAPHLQTPRLRRQQNQKQERGRQQQHMLATGSAHGVGSRGRVLVLQLLAEVSICCQGGGNRQELGYDQWPDSCIHGPRCLGRW